MPTAIALVVGIILLTVVLRNYIKERVIWPIHWEHFAFRDEYISEMGIELPQGKQVPFYPKRNLGIKAREEFYEWVFTDELVPTGNILVGNKGVKWLEVRRRFTIGYIPEAILHIEKVVPVKYVQDMYQ